MAERLLARGVPAHTIHVIPNWSDDEAIVPIPAANNILRRAWGLNGQVCGRLLGQSRARP